MTPRSSMFLSCPSTVKYTIFLFYRTGELEKEAVGLKQRLKLKDEELITMKKEKEDLLTRYVNNNTISYLQDLVYRYL